MEDYTPPSVISRLGELLPNGLPHTHDDLVEHIELLLSVQMMLAQQTSEWLVRLYDMRRRTLWPKDKDKTELDRKTLMDAATAQVEADYQLLTKLEDITKERLRIATLLLKD